MALDLSLLNPQQRSAVVQTAKTALDAGRDRYCPPGGLGSLQEAISAYLEKTRNLAIAPENLVMTPGCKCALFLAMMTLVEAGDEVLYPEAGFPIYPSLARAMGGRPVAYRLAESSHFQPDPDEVAARITPRTKLLIVNSPSNPTGAVFETEIQRRLAEVALEHDLLVISDEVYARIVYGGTYTSIAGLPRMAERVLIVDGFSKSFGMTGWRLGYAVAPASIVPALHMLIVNTYTCVSEFIQHAAVEALRRQEDTIPRMVQELALRREQFVSDLNRVPGFRCALPDGAFYAWVNIAETGLSAEELCQVMLEQAGVAAVPGAAFGPSGKNFIRFAFATPTPLLQEAVKRILRISSVWRTDRAVEKKPGVVRKCTRT